MIRVLHVLCDLNGGGAERLVLDLVRLGGPQVRAEVAVLHPGGALVDDFARASVVVHQLGRSRGRLGLRALDRLRRIAARFDVVHTHLWAGDTWGRVGGALARAPVVVSTEHNTRPEDAWRQWVGRATAPLARRVVCVSAAARDVAMASGLRPSQLEVVPNGVDLSRFPPAPWRLGPPWRVAAFGRLAAQKGFDRLVGAAHLLSDMDVRVTVFGDGPDRAALTAAAGAGPGRVQVRSWTSDVSAAMADAHIIAVPSRWEGFGLVAAEAMAAGRAVMVSDIEPLSSVVGDVGLRVAGDRPDDWARAVRAALADPSDLAHRAGAGPAWASRWDVRRTADAYAAVYSRLTAGRPHP